MKSRSEILTAARDATMTTREYDYGPPVKNMKDIAALWQTYLSSKRGIVCQVDAEDVAHMMSLLKIARTFAGGFKADTYVDAAAYAAIAGECSATENPSLVTDHTRTSEHSFGACYHDTFECNACGLRVKSGEPYPSNCAGTMEPSSE